ncbi:MAG: restriction endonuclease subunit S [Atopobiaceae bacterium]|nr:restriction endonuclease subunit S [Atopobiaceae bacterium]
MPDCMPLFAVCDFTMGQSPSSDTYNTNGDGMPFYQGNADFGKRSPSPRVWCNSPKKTANEGDILISVRAPIGAINIAAEQCCIGRGLAALAVRPDAATRDYLEHYLRYKRPELERRGTGSTFKAVGKKIFAEMTLPIVSVDEQSEIAKKLNNALELQEEAASQISMLDELVKSRFSWEVAA